MCDNFDWFEQLLEEFGKAKNKWKKKKRKKWHSPWRQKYVLEIIYKVHFVLGFQRFSSLVKIPLKKFVYDLKQHRNRTKRRSNNWFLTKKHKKYDILETHFIYLFIYFFSYYNVNMKTYRIKIIIRTFYFQRSVI